MWHVTEVSVVCFLNGNEILCCKSCSLSLSPETHFGKHHIVRLHMHEGFPEVLHEVVNFKSVCRRLTSNSMQ